MLKVHKVNMKPQVCEREPEQYCRFKRTQRLLAFFLDVLELPSQSEQTQEKGISHGEDKYPKASSDSQH